LEAVIRIHALVLPAASSPSISSRISFEPKIRFIIFDIWPPMMAIVEVVVRSDEYESCSIELVGWAQDERVEAVAVVLVQRWFWGGEPQYLG
jgi:hypothetical protein